MKTVMMLMLLGHYVCKTTPYSTPEVKEIRCTNTKDESDWVECRRLLIDGKQTDVCTDSSGNNDVCRIEKKDNVHERKCNQQ